MIFLIQNSLTITSTWNLHWIGMTMDIETPNNKPNIELWEDLAGDDKIFHEDFLRVITNEDIPEADDIFDTEEFDN